MNNKIKQTNISLVMILRDESKNLEKNLVWLYSCKNIKELIVVDDNSKDNTIEIIKKMVSKNKQLKIFKKELNGNFANQKNFAVSKTKHNLVLFLDADEQPSKKLIQFLDNIEINRYKNYSFKRQDLFLKNKLKHGETSQLDFIRLFDKRHGEFIGKVHEVWKSDKPTKKTKLIIYHYPHKTLKSIIQKINFYSDIRSKEMFDLKVKTNLFQIIFFPIGKFIQNYVFRLGFMDGTPGIIMALSMSLHVFLSKAKLWHLYQQ